MIEYRWNVTVEAAVPVEAPAPAGAGGVLSVLFGDAEQNEGGTENHTVTARMSRLAGRITVTIDGDSFVLPAGLLGLTAARREVFRLGDEQAVLCVEKNGKMSLLLRGETISPEEIVYGAGV